MLSFKKSLIVEQFQGKYITLRDTYKYTDVCVMSKQCNEVLLRNKQFPLIERLELHCVDYCIVLKTGSWIMEFKSFHWLSHHSI